MAVIVIQIELLIAIIIVLMFLVWAIWFRFTRWRAKRQYNKKYIHNDKSKQGEERAERARGDERNRRRSTEKGSHPSGSAQLERRGDIQATTPDAPRKDSKSFRGIFKRIGRRK